MRSTSGRAAVGLLGVIWGVHLVAQLVPSAGLVADVTQVGLMPLLLWMLLAETTVPRSRVVGLVAVALGFSWLGDTLPRFTGPDLGFLLMVAMFLVAQFFFIAAFVGYRRDSIVWQAPGWTIPYVVAAVALLGLCWSGAGDLFVPIVVYAVALTTMAILATGLGRLAALGGALFMFSDSLIALRAFADVSLPGSGFWVMLTYVAGQVLLVLAVLSMQPDARAPRTLHVADPSR